MPAAPADPHADAAAPPRRSVTSRATPAAATHTHTGVHHLHLVPCRGERDAGHQAALPGDDYQEPEEVLQLRGAGERRPARPRPPALAHRGWGGQRLLLARAGRTACGDRARSLTLAGAHSAHRRCLTTRTCAAGSARPITRRAPAPCHFSVAAHRGRTPRVPEPACAASSHTRTRGASFRGADRARRRHARSQQRA